IMWRPSETDAITGELLFSSTENPDRPDLSPAWNGESSKSHAFHADWNRQKEHYDAGVTVNDIGDDFRADLGFIPQVGYREFSGSVGLRFFPTSPLARFVRPSFFVDRQTDTNGDVIYRRSSPGILVQGFKNLSIGFTFHPSEQYRVGDQMLSETYVD